MKSIYLSTGLSYYFVSEEAAAVSSTSQDKLRISDDLNRVFSGIATVVSCDGW